MLHKNNNLVLSFGVVDEFDDVRMVKLRVDQAFLACLWKLVLSKQLIFTDLLFDDFLQERSERGLFDLLVECAGPEQLQHGMPRSFRCRFLRFPCRLQGPDQTWVRTLFLRLHHLLEESHDQCSSLMRCIFLPCCVLLSNYNCN
jgi:hypothetical protein